MTDFEIGVITKAQGIKGEFRVLPTTDDASRFSLLVGEEIYLDGKAFKLTNARQQKNIVILKLDEVNDRNMAESLTGRKIAIPAEKALPLETDEYYVRDLKGLKVETEEGEELGIIDQILHTNANDVYVIKSPEGESFMIPAIKEVVRAVSVREGKVTIRLLDGLRELKV